jgi:hypothetical protein
VRGGSARLIRPPRVHLGNELIVRRHLNAVLLADFVRNRHAAGQELHSIGDLLRSPAEGQPVPLDDFLDALPAAVKEHDWLFARLVPEELRQAFQEGVEQTRQGFLDARAFFAGEVEMYQQALDERKVRRDELEKQKEYGKANKLSGFLAFLQERLDALDRQDWVSFFSDRTVLPGYAFPIYNVSLETRDADLKLERDLRLALSEYAPGAAIIAKARLWRSIGICTPPRHNALPRQTYAVCPHCRHVERHLEQDRVFAGSVCPVCRDNGRAPVRMKRPYVVPTFGFTTDLQTKGEDLRFDRPLRIPASQVLFVPQQESNDPARLTLGGGGGPGVEVRSTERADFFVFNAGDDPSRRGFRLCKSCGRQAPDQAKVPWKHETPLGKPCQGSLEWVHLGHDFRSCAARLTFLGSLPSYAEQSFWLSLLHALLGGLTDALGIEGNDVNGVVRPINLQGMVVQELVLFDDVPGGAGHVRRLEEEEDLKAVLRAAHKRVAECECDEQASCYRCLRGYRNQSWHDLLVRGPVADYLAGLLATIEQEPDDDRRVSSADPARLLRASLAGSTTAYVVADYLTLTGPPETGPWHLLLQELLARQRTVRLAVRQPKDPQARGAASVLPLLALQQAGAEVVQLRPGVPAPPYALVCLGPGEKRTAFHWGGQERTTALDSEAHRRPLWVNRSSGRLAGIEAELGGWFTQHTEPLRLELPAEGASPSFSLHAVKKDETVSFHHLFRSVVAKKLARVILQDPYLLTRHQLRCLENFLAALAGEQQGGQVPFHLITQMSEGDPRRMTPDTIPPADHRAELTEAFALFPMFDLRLELCHRRSRPLHMRFVVFIGEDGSERSYLLERGLDLADPRTGRARGDSWVLEMDGVAEQFRSLLPAI